MVGDGVGVGVEIGVEVSGAVDEVVVSDVTVGVSTLGAGVCTGQTIVFEPGCSIPPPFTS